MDLAKLIHLVAAILWMGGMAFMILALRPAAVARLQPPDRLELMGAIWKRFFAIVMVSIVALFATGATLYATAFRAVKAASGEGAVPLGWNVMVVLGLLMMALFGHIYFVGFARFKRAVRLQDWPMSGKAAAQIHTFMFTNFVLGWLAIAAVRLVR